MRLNFHVTWLPDHFSPRFCSIFTSETRQLLVLMYVFHLHRDLLHPGAPLHGSSSLGFQRSPKVICWGKDKIVFKSFKHGNFNKSKSLEEETKMSKHFHPFEYLSHFCLVPVPVTARSKVWVYGRSPAQIMGSNPTGVMDVCLLWMLCVVR